MNGVRSIRVFDIDEESRYPGDPVTGQAEGVQTGLAVLGMGMGMGLALSVGMGMRIGVDTQWTWRWEWNDIHLGAL
jgi:hypothetical protein